MKLVLFGLLGLLLADCVLGSPLGKSKHTVWPKTGHDMCIFSSFQNSVLTNLDRFARKRIKIEFQLKLGVLFPSIRKSRESEKGQTFWGNFPLLRFPVKSLQFSDR